MIQARELACQLVGLVEGRVDRARQPEMFGDRRERGQHGEGIGTADDVLFEDLAGAFAQGESLGQEEEVELTALRGARGVLETVESDLTAGLGVPPRGVVVHAAQVGAQDDLFTGSAHEGLAQVVA